MADNTTLNRGVEGDVIRDIEKTTDGVTAKTQSVVLDAGGSGAESLVSSTNPLPSRMYDGSGNPVYVDAFSYAVGIIEQEHFKIHQGKGFTTGHRFTVADGGSVFDFLLVNPAGNYPHLRHLVINSDGGPYDIDFYEGATTSADGTALTSYNNNRNSATTSSLLAYHTPTVTTAGTNIEPILTPGTKQSGATGSDGENEWGLKLDTKYLIRLTNNTPGGGTSNFTLNMFHYE